MPSLQTSAKLNSSDVFNNGLAVVLTLALLCFALLFPTFHAALGTKGAIIVNGGLLFGSVIVVVLGRHRLLSLPHRQKTAIAVIAFSMAYYGFCICVSTLLMSNDVIFRDLFELHKPIFYFFVFLIPFSVLNSEKDLIAAQKVAYFLFAAIIIFGLLQHFRVSDLFSKQFTKMHNIKTRRVSIPFSNPYDYALMMSLFFCVGLTRFAAHKSWRHLLVAITAVAMMILTQSRALAIASTIAMVAGIGLTVILALVSRQAIYRQMLGRLSLALSTLGFILYMGQGLLIKKFGYLFKGIANVSKGRADKSLRLRINQWDTILNLATDDPLKLLLGNGVSKSAGIGVESIYSFYLYRYGLIALSLLFVLPIIGGLMSSARLFEREPHRYAACLGLFCWFIVVLISSLSNNFTEQVRLSFVYYIVLAGVMRFDFMTAARTGAAHG